MLNVTVYDCYYSTPSLCIYIYFSPFHIVMHKAMRSFWNNILRDRNCIYHRKSQGGGGE